MKKKIIFLSLLGILVLIGLISFFIQQKNPLPAPQSHLIKIEKEVNPSETYIEYTDPSGFSFSYPDNLSISKAEIEDLKTYADLQLYSKDVNGSLSLRITDSKFTSLNDWLKANEIPSSNTPKDVKLGNLKALEVTTNDRLLLGALDQGVFFNIEMPLIQKDFWMKVYNRILTEFTFTLPDAKDPSGISNSSSEDVIFEGEELVE